MAVMTYREALNLALREEMRRDPNVFVIGEEVGLYEGAYKVTQGLLKEFGPKRVVDTPIAESGFTGVGIGAPMDAKGLLKAAIRDDNPVIFIESETLYAVKGEVPDDPDFVIPLGQAIVRREGRDVTVVAYMGMMYRAMEAAEELEKEGISVEIVDPRTLRPMDAGTIIKSVRKTHRVGV